MTGLPDGARTSADPLVSEANHRIANSLSVIAAIVRLQAGDAARHGPFTGEAVTRMLKEVAGRIDTVGRLHRMLSGVGVSAVLELEAYLHAVATTTVSSLSLPGHVLLRDVSTGGCEVPAEQALQFGLIVTEMVTNAVKYAHPAGVAGTITIGCRREDGMTVVEVSDDGVGLPEGFDPRRGGGLGFRLMRSIAAQLSGTLEFEHDGLGLRCRLSVPRPAIGNGAAHAGEHAAQAPAATALPN